MKITLTEGREIKGKRRKKGETVVVRKDEGERLLDKGLATRVIAIPENRIVVPSDNRGARRFSGHKVFGREK